MATQVASLTVQIVTVTPDGNDLFLEAEINSEDNDGVSTYQPNVRYYARLYKSSNVTSLSKFSNIGSLGLSSSGLTESVPAEGETEYLAFSGSNSGSLDKSYNSGFSYSPVGTVFDINGAATSVSLTPTPGFKTVIASKEIYGVFEVSYVTKYDLYWFQSTIVGTMLMVFIGSNT